MRETILRYEQKPATGGDDRYCYLGIDAISAGTTAGEGRVRREGFFYFGARCATAKVSCM